MRFKKKTNPNTLEAMDEHYRKIDPTKERLVKVLIPMYAPYIPKDGKILDVGCGIGRMLYELTTRAKLTGIDISPVACSKGISHYSYIDFKCGSYEQITQPYDLILSSQSFEHMDKKDILGFVDKFKEFGKTVWISVPWPNSNLDKSIKNHWVSFDPKDFKEWFPGCVVSPAYNFMCIYWKNPKG